MSFKKLFNLSSIKKRTLISGIILFIAGTFCVTYYLYTSNNPYISRGIEVVKSNNDIKVTKNTEFIQKTRYLKCKDEEVINKKPSENLVGANYNDLQKMYPTWTIEVFDEDKIEIVMELDSMCREHANNVFIGAKDGKIAVFYGIPNSNKQPIVKEITNISLDSLMPEDIIELQKGIVVKSKEDLLRTLEGIHGN